MIKSWTFGFRKLLRYGTTRLLQTLGIMRAEPYLFNYQNIHTNVGASELKPSEILAMSSNEFLSKLDEAIDFTFYHTRWHPRIAPIMFSLSPRNTTIKYSSATRSNISLIFQNQEPNDFTFRTFRNIFENPIPKCDEFELLLDEHNILELVSNCSNTVKIKVSIRINSFYPRRFVISTSLQFCDVRDALAFKMRVT
jgi:hypothetical protein